MKSARILITEDDPATRTYLRILLQSEGCLVAEAAHGAAAFDLVCNQNPPDVVLLDLTMPGVDGYEFLEALADMNPRPRSRVVVVTADHASGLAADLAALGADGMFYKPLRREDLRRIMETVPADVGSTTSEPVKLCKTHFLLH